MNQGSETQMTETFTDYQAALDIIGDRAREAREAAGLTQEQLGKLIGASQPEVSRWEAGGRILSLADFLAIADALKVPAAALLPDEHQDLAAPVPGGQFLHIAFMGHTELTGWVTDITLGGEAAYHIDLPDKLWGGNPLAWEEYSAKALFGRSPVAEASVRKAWEAERRRAAERAREEAEWRRTQEQRAITANGAGDLDDETCGCGDPDCEGTPA